MRTEKQILIELNKIYAIENIDLNYKIGIIIALTWVLDFHASINLLTTNDLKEYQEKTNRLEKIK